MTADYLLRSAQTLVIKQRLQWMKEYESTQNVNTVCKQFGISRKTFYKWLKRYTDSNKDASSLIDVTRRPHTLRTKTSEQVREKILRLREQTGFGPRKIESRLREDDIRISSTSIWKIISHDEKEYAA